MRVDGGGPLRGYAVKSLKGLLRAFPTPFTGAIAPAYWLHWEPSLACIPLDALGYVLVGGCDAKKGRPCLVPKVASQFLTLRTGPSRLTLGNQRETSKSER